MKRRVIAFLLIAALVVGLLPITAFAEPVNDLSMCNLRFGGSDGQYDVVVESKDEAVHLDEIPVEVIDRNGNEVDPEKYDLTVSVYKGWDEENQSPDILWLTDTFRLTDYDVYAEQGYGWFGVSATAKDGSGLTGSTRPQNINVRHLYSFNGYCVTVKFDDDYKVDPNPWADQNYYVIPSNRIFDPEVWNRAGEFVDPKYYTVTYYRRNMEDIEYDDYRDPEYLARRYPEVDPLDSIPSEPGCYFAVTEAKAPYYGKNYVDIDIIEPESENNLGKDFELLIDGESWKVFPVENLSDLLSIEDLNITVVDKNDKAIDPEKYTLNIGMQVGWDEEENMPIISEIPAPYGVDFDPNDEDRSSGFTTYRVNAVAKNDSGYTGGTEARNFMIWHQYSFNYFGANATFGENDEFKGQAQMTWHDKFDVPVDRMAPPTVHGITWEDSIDPQYYDLTYFVRHEEVMDDVESFDDYDEEKERQRYSEDDPLDEMPTEPGTYFVRIDGKEPYYGTSYVDFDIVDPFSLNGANILFDGREEWEQDYYLDSKEDTLTLSDLNITVVTQKGDVIPADQYDLHIGVQTGYDDVKHEPIIQWSDGPYGLTSVEAQLFGWQMHCVKATAKADGDYNGETRIFEFMLRDKHSLERDSAYIDFGEEYLYDAHRSWHTAFTIPEGEIEAPDVYNCLEEKLDPDQYTLTYYVRGEDVGFDDPDRMQKIYPETDALDKMPTEQGRYFVRLDAKEPYYGKSYVDFDIVGADAENDLSNCGVFFDCEDWKVFPIENKDDTLDVDDLKITVVDQKGRQVPKDAYDLVFGMTYWDNDKEEDVFIPVSAPFSLTVNDDYMHSGFGGFSAYAVAKEDGGYTGQTESREFMLWHKYSFNWFGANADFGGEYRGQCTWSWHDYFAIPEGEMHEPVIHGIANEGVDPQYYELTYFERGEQPDFDDPEYDQKLYPETDPLDEMPTEPGKYFVRLDAKDPYYGKSYVDFDIVEVPESFAIVRGAERKYYDGDTIYMHKNEEICVRFALEFGEQDLLAGWLSDGLREAGFEVVDGYKIDGEDYTYCKIKSGDLAGGTTAELDYCWYHFFDVFHDGGFHWDEATPFRNCTVNISVLPDDYDYLLGDADGNGEIESIDVTYIQRSLAEMTLDVDFETVMQGDVDGDGELTVIDATFVQRWLAYMHIPCEVGKPIVLS